MVDSDDDGGDYAELMAEYPLDILEYANSYAFVIDMPGLDPDDVSVQVKPCVLLISGEGRRVEVEGAKYIRMERRSMSKFVRKFGLPENANTGKFTTVLRNGVLTVTVEKLPPPQPKAIEVKQEQLRSRGDERKLHIGAVDRMSMLPDELLVCILSLLSIKEATATCILCRRWRHLHTFRIKLDFDGTKVLQKALQMKSKDYFEEVRQKILRGVDGVVRLNQSSRLEKFRVVHHLIESDTHRIDNWVRFALSRKVESLELLSARLGIRKEQYTLNLHKCNYDFNFMKKLSTQWVKVSGEAVEMLLRNCPLLEQVSIAQSEELLGLEIIKPFPTFRSLEILMCSNLSSIVVDDSNIVSFKYWGKRVNKVELVNVPLLTEIWIYETSVEDMFEMFSSVLPQLHTFKICITCFSRQNLRVFCSRFCSFVKMSNLKQLVVDISDMYYKEDLLPLIDLIKAFPGLQRFVIQEAYEKDCADDDFVEGIPTEIQMASSVDRMALKANTQLKEVEFVGYRGVSTHFELLKYLVENAIALETILVDPWGFKESDYIFSFDQIPRRKYNDKIIARANALKHLVPIGINDTTNAFAQNVLAGIPSSWNGRN